MPPVVTSACRLPRLCSALDADLSCRTWLAERRVETEPICESHRYATATLTSDVIPELREGVRLVVPMQWGSTQVRRDEYGEGRINMMNNKQREMSDVERSHA
jgi:urease gamma subunit